MPSALDPLNINGRLYNQVSELLRSLEENPNATIRDRYLSLVAIGRIQTIFVALRKERLDEPNRGASVRKYAGAFKANAAGRRKAIAGSARAQPEPDDASLGDIWGDDESDDTA